MEDLPAIAGTYIAVGPAGLAHELPAAVNGIMARPSSTLAVAAAPNNVVNTFQLAKLRDLLRR